MSVTPFPPDRRSRTSRAAARMSCARMPMYWRIAPSQVAAPSDCSPSARRMPPLGGAAQSSKRMARTSVACVRDITWHWREDDAYIKRSIVCERSNNRKRRQRRVRGLQRCAYRQARSTEQPRSWHLGFARTRLPSVLQGLPRGAGH